MLGRGENAGAGLFRGEVKVGVSRRKDGGRESRGFLEVQLS